MRALLRLKTLAGVAIAAMGLSAHAAPIGLANSNLGVFAFLQYNTYQNQTFFNGYVAFPDLVSEPNGQTNQTTLESPGFVSNGSGFHSTLNPGETFAGGGSLIYSSFAEYKSELNTNGWRLTTNSDTISPTQYTLNVNASAVNDFATRPAVISAGINGATYQNGATPTFTWTGPTSGFTTLDVSLTDLDDSNQNQHVSLDPAATSYSFPNPLTNGTYQLQVSYGTDGTGKVTASTPVDGMSNPLSNWDGVTGVNIQLNDTVQFAVPEPTTGLLTAVAGTLLLRRRRAGK